MHQFWSSDSLSFKGPGEIVLTLCSIPSIQVKFESFESFTRREQILLNFLVLKIKYPFRKQLREAKTLVSDMCYKAYTSNSQ